MRQSGGRQFTLGKACGTAVIHAGVRFFTAYPITPSTDVAEYTALELPDVRGKFIQIKYKKEHD